MSRKCRECGEQVKIVGLGPLQDTIDVSCPSCGECYEIEPDGFNEGGFEFVEAQMIEAKLRERV